MERRIRPLSPIKTEKQLAEYEERLNCYLTEYLWFTCSNETPTGDILRAKAREIGNDNGTSLSEEAKLALENRADAVDHQEYLPILSQNMTALLIAIESYQAKSENKSWRDVLVGLMRGEKETKDYLERLWLQRRAQRVNPAMTEVTNPGILSKEACARSVCEAGNLVALVYEPESAPETSLVPVENPKYQEIADQTQALLTRFLEEKTKKYQKPQEKPKVEQPVEEPNRESHRESVRSGAGEDVVIDRGEMGL